MFDIGQLTDVRTARSGILICRNEGVTDTHIYAPHGIITHGLLTLSAITAQLFYRSDRKSERRIGT
jgi:hypothetical protein